MPDLYASPQLQASIRAGQAPLWSDYLKTVGIGTTDVLAAVPAGTRYVAELTDTDLGESIASSSQYLQDVVHGWGEDLEAGLSEPARERLLAEFGSEEFWKHPASSIALKAARTTPSMAASVGATMFTGGGAPAFAMMAGVQGGLSATQTVDEMYRTVDSMSDADLRASNKLYNQFRQDGLSEREARVQFNRVNIGAKPAVLFAVGAATSLFGPEAMIARTLGAKGLGEGFRGGILKRTGKAMGAGAVSEAIETGAESIAAEQGAVDVGFQTSINPYRVAAATAEGATLGALFGTVGGLRGPTRPPVRPTTNANPRPEPDNPPAAAIKPIVTPAPGPVSMPGKGSDTQASPPIVAGRVPHTAPTATATTVLGAKGAAYKKTKGAKTNVVPIVEPAPATGTAAAPTTVVVPAPQVVAAPIASPAPRGDPGGLVAGQTEAAALAAQTAPTRPPGPQGGVSPTPTAPRTPSQVQQATGVPYAQARAVSEQEAAATAPAPTPPAAPAAAPTSSQVARTPGAEFGAGTVAAPVPTQAVSTEATPSAFGGVAQPVGPAPIEQQAAPVTPRVLPVAPTADNAEAIARQNAQLEADRQRVAAAEIAAPEIEPPAVYAGKDKNRNRKIASDGAVAQTLLDARPAEPVIPANDEEIATLKTELEGILESGKAQKVLTRTKVGHPAMPDSLVWYREIQELLKYLNTNPDDAGKYAALTRFFDREYRIKRGEGAAVKAEREQEAAAAVLARKGGKATTAPDVEDTGQGAATEEQAAVTEQAEDEGTAETAVGSGAETGAKPVKGVAAPTKQRKVARKGGGTITYEVAQEVEEKPEVATEELTKTGEAIVAKTKAQQKIADIKAAAKKAEEEKARKKGAAALEEIKKRTAAENAAKTAARAKADAEAKAKADQILAELQAEKEAKAKQLPPKVTPKVAEVVEKVKRKPLGVKATPEAVKAAIAKKAAAAKEKAQAASKDAGKVVRSEELAKVDPDPSDAQIAADNASKGHLSLEGMQVSVSTAAKTERHGISPTGSRWSYLYNFSYGHILGTKAPDGKPIDIFLGPQAYPKNPKLEGLPVIIIEQVDPDTKVPDEPKVMYGFDTPTDAVEAYEESYPRGPERRGDVVVMTPREFAQWRRSKEDRTSQVPTGEPVSELDVALEEAVTGPEAEARLSDYEIGKPRPVSPHVPGSVEYRTEKFRERSEGVEAVAAAFASRSGKLSEFLDTSSDVMKAADFVSPLARALYPRFAKRIKAIAGDIQVYVVSDEVFVNQLGKDPNTGAFYNMANDFIVVRESEALLDETNFAAIMLHEAVHAAFMKAAYSSPKMLAKLEVILAEARAAQEHVAPNQKFYGLHDIDEMMAEAFSNLAFQQYLLDVRPSEQLIKDLGLDGKFRSMWDVVVRLVGMVLGTPRPHDTLLGAVMKMTARLELGADSLKGPASDEVMYNWYKHDDALQAGVTFGPDPGFRILERINKRLPPQVRQAPQQQQQGTPWLMFLRTMDQIVQLAKGFGRPFYEHLRRAADIIERIRVSADRYLEESMPVIRKLHALQNKYKGTQWWDRFTALVYDETQAQIYADRPLSAQKKLTGKNALRGAYPKARWAVLNAEWNAINAAAPDLAAVRLEAMNFFKEQQNKERIGIIRNSLRVAGFADPDLTQRLFDGDETDADIALLGTLYDHIKDASELAKLKGPYFPMMRRGKYVVRALYKIIAPTNAFREIPDLKEDGSVDYVRTWEFAGKGARKQAMAYAAAQKDTGLHPTVQSVWVDKNTGERYFNLGQPDEVRVRPQDVDSEQRFRVTIQNRYVEFYESKREARQVAFELRNDPAVDRDSVQDVVERRFQVGDRQTDMMSHQIRVLASSLQRKAGYNNLSPMQQNQVVQTLNIASARFLSHTRIQTKRLPRTNVLGYSRDLTRNTLEYAESVSGYLARLDHQDELNNAMRDARREADSARDYGKGLGQSAIMNEMERRVARSTAFEERGIVNDWINRSLIISFADKLISPAYNLLNSLQVIMMTYPTLAARYGPGRAAQMLFRVYADIGVGQVLKSGLVASKRALREGPSAEFPNLITDIKARLKSTREISLLDYIIERGGIDPDAGIEVGNMIQTRTGAVGTIDQGINYVQTFGRQMPRSIEAINRTVTAIAAYRLEMQRSGDHDVATRYAQETNNMTQGLYSHSNAAPIFNHPLGKISFQFKKYGQLVYGLIGHNVGKAIRNAEPGDRAEAVKTLAYMAATHVVMAGALGLPTEPLKWLIIGANQAGVTEANWADVENYVREILASAFGQQLGEIAARGVSRALPAGFAFDMSSRVGLQDLFTFGEPRSADQQDLKSFMWDVVGGAPVSLAGDWFKGSQALMNGEWVEAAERFTPIKVVADAIKSYRVTSEGKKTEAGYESLAPYSMGEAAIRTLGFTPARESETAEARNYFYSATKRASAERNSLMQDWYQASGSARGRLWGQIEKFNYGKTSDEKLTRSELDKYTKRRRTEERSGLVKSGFRVTRRETQSYKKLQGTYNINP